MPHRHPAYVLLPVTLALVLLTTTALASSQHTSPLPTAAGLPTPSWAQTATASPTHTEPVRESPWVVRVYYDDRRLVDELATWREPWAVHHDKGYLILDVTPTEYRQLLDAGFQVEIDLQLTAQLRAPRIRLPNQVNGIPGYPCYRTVEETFAAAETIVTNHPELATWIDAGDSWEKTASAGNQGYDLMVLRLTNAAVAGPKPKLFIVTSIHAREYTPAELSSRFAQHLVNSYGSDPDVTWILDYHEIHLLLQANPDGRKWAEGGDLWRKNTDNNYCPNTSMRGVDLNRNFVFQWGCCGGSSDQECSEVYRGPAAASEPETQAIQSYVRGLFPDQRQDDLSAAAPITTTGVFLDLHSSGGLVLWPWGFARTPAPNGTALRTLGRKLAHFNGYLPEQAYELYPTDGTTDDFAYGELGLAAYTFELGTEFFQDCLTFENTIVPDNLPALIYAAKVSRAPYLTPFGPDALDVVVTPWIAVSGQIVHLTATIDDTRYNNQNGTEPTRNIAAGEYYIDVPPWATHSPPIPHPLTAVDGAFDEKIEDVEATIDTIALTPGRHTVFLRGQDADGNWGAVSAVFLHVGEPSRFYLPFVDRHN